MPSSWLRIRSYANAAAASAHQLPRRTTAETGPLRLSRSAHSIRRGDEYDPLSHICDRNGPSEKVIDDSGDKPIGEVRPRDADLRATELP
jgi:hypothetical protein